MIIKIKHPELDSTLLVQVDYQEDNFKKLKDYAGMAVSHKDSNSSNSTQQHFMFAVHDPKEERNHYQFDLGASQENLKYALYPIYAPSLDSLVQQFIDTGSVKTNEDYKTWVV